MDILKFLRFWRFVVSGFFQMSVASDSPVHSSSSDDLAAFLETELDSGSDSSSESFPIEEAAEDDTEVSNHRFPCHI